MILSYDEFVSNEIFNKHTPMSCEDMIIYMMEHTDLYVACDMNDAPAESYQYLVDLVLQMNAEELLN